MVSGNGAMKYFTLDSWIRDQELDSVDADSDHPRQRYKAYLENVRDRLPLDYVTMSESVCIHDATMPELKFDVSAGALTIRLNAGDVTMREGRMVELHYGRVAHFSTNSDPDKGLPGPHGFGDLGYDEIEVLDDGSYEHRLLFSSGIELIVRFGDFRLEVL